MSTTDPLREALKRACEDIAAINAAGFDSERLRLSNDARGRIIEALAAAPVEPEAWEWRVSDGAGGWGPASKSLAAEFLGADLAIERRRPGTPPGEWERVDPDPWRDDDEDEALIAAIEGPRVDPEPRGTVDVLMDAARRDLRRRGAEPRLQDGGE